MAVECHFVNVCNGTVYRNVSALPCPSGWTNLDYYAPHPTCDSTSPPSPYILHIIFPLLI